MTCVILHLPQSLSIATLAIGIFTAFNLELGSCTMHMLQFDMETRLLLVVRILYEWMIMFS